MHMLMFLPELGGTLVTIVFFSGITYLVFLILLCFHSEARSAHQGVVAKATPSKGRPGAESVF